MMRTFNTYDNTLCEGEGCRRKEKCVRYLTHLKAVKEKWPYPVAYMLWVGKDCEMFVEATEEKK